MKKLLSLSLALFLLIFFALPALAEDSSNYYLKEEEVTISVGGYTFSLSSSNASHCNFFLDTHLGLLYVEPTFDDIEYFNMSIKYNDGKLYLPVPDSDLKGSDQSYREAFLTALASVLPAPDLSTLEITHRDDLSIATLYYVDASQYLVLAAVSDQAPHVVIRAAVDSPYIEVLNNIAETLTFSYFQIEPENLSSEELLAMREQIDQALANLENQE